MSSNLNTISCLFLDIGGVILTDGWPLQARKAAALAFDINYDELEIRHQLNFSTYEEGRMTLDDYLGHAVFYEKREFTREQFRNYMFTQSKPYPSMIQLMTQVKRLNQLKIIVVSNEARELNDHRIGTFGLGSFVDAFVSSCFVRMRKPDPEIFKLAIDIAQVKPAQVLYIENTKMFVEVAQSLGIKSIFHESFESTHTQMRNFGLRTQEEAADARY